MISILNPVPTLFSESQQKLPGSIFPAIVKTRNPPAEWNIQEDDLATFSCKDSIKDFSGINDSLSPILGEDFYFRKYENNAVYFIFIYFFEKDALSVHKRHSLQKGWYESAWKVLLYMISS